MSTTPAAAEGDRVEFIGFGDPDPYANLEPGTKGVVIDVDDSGTVHVRWDDGHVLGMITRPWVEGQKGFMPDRFRVIREEEAA
jgi:hypothetical protein